jgi:hypothetical protein
MSIWLGYDQRETTAFAVARYSIRRFDRYIPIYGLVLDHLRDAGLYTRPTEVIKRGSSNQMWDVISSAPMSTEFSISRFLVPYLAETGWALFADCDILVRANISRLFDLARLDKAVMVVKHDYRQGNGMKMDGQLQTIYPRKNWSSVMLFNCDHPSNKKLTVELVNSALGRDLHRFCWLDDNEIGELPPEWNYLVSHSKLSDRSPAIVHFTEGLPDMPGYEMQEYADEWRELRPYAVGAL